MGDLSNLLGDVYGDDDDDKDAAKNAATGAPQGEAEATPEEDRAPEWSADERLDQAFAEWSPGPPPEAPAAAEADTTVAEAVAATVPLARPWQRGDDDILPPGRRRRGFRPR